MRKFDGTMALSESELVEIKQEMETLVPLVKDIRVKFEIVQRENTTAKFGEYCLLLYSEKKPHYLLNAGYLLEQMDLYLNARDIGVCWYGLAKADKKMIGDLHYVIMLAFGKSRSEDFRKDGMEFKRKSREEIWSGEFDSDVIEAVRLAPSACNSQPWRVRSEGNMIRVLRDTKAKSIMPAMVKPFFNTIDMGIFLCFLEIAIKHKGYEMDRTLIVEEKLTSKLIEIAKYFIK